ncbi:hypothetical protein VTJ49DRAFT_6546 [Mycothermus thermophilus]|uniref:DUF676 domain-containing protein n=1 Tax=Humicola insolens TaxID=85995 RepID=A0ABR3VIS8_HUMIN
MAQVRREGLSLISNGITKRPDGSEVPPVVDIIFVHGLNGHPENTWRGETGRPSGEKAKRSCNIMKFWSKKRETVSQKVFWPHVFLREDIKNARIFTYGYNANVAEGFLKGSNQNNIYNHGRDLAAKFQRELGEDNHYPIIFVVHSLGGIIVKDAIHQSRFLRERTKLVVFFGTPH